MTRKEFEAWLCPTCQMWSSEDDFELSHHVLYGPDHKPKRVRLVRPAEEVVKP